MRLIPIVLVAALLGGPAVAGSGFTPYESRDPVVEGQGGTRVSGNGVDFWTTGTPPRRYRILGVLSDTRPDSGFGSNPTKSRALAERIRAAGGDAAIVLGSDTQLAGAFNVGYGVTVTNHDRTTQFLVVRYEP